MCIQKSAACNVYEFARPSRESSLADLLDPSDYSQRMRELAA